MKRNIACVFLVIAFLMTMQHTFATTELSTKAQQELPAHKEGSVLVKYSNLTSRPSKKTFFEQHNISVQKEFSNNVVLLQ